MTVGDETATEMETDMPDGVEITGPMHARFDEILTDQALELVALLHRELNPRREELLAKRRERVRATFESISSSARSL